MAPQASKKCGLLPPDHQQIGSCTSNGNDAEQAPGTLSVLREHCMVNLTSLILLLLVIAVPAPPALAQIGTSATVDGIEITQSIQSMGPCSPPSSIIFPCAPQNVPLIGGKPTVVRVYLTLTMSSPAQPIIRGALQGTRGAGILTSSSLPPHLDLTNPAVQLEHGTLQLNDKRNDIRFSLNFLLPGPWIAEGALTLITLNLINDVTASPIPCTNCPFTDPSPSFSFLASPTLRVRLIGVQYQNPKTSIPDSAPTPTDYKFIKSWLHRAYPVATNKLIVDTNPMDAVVAGFPDSEAYESAGCNTTLTKVSGVHSTATPGLGQNDDINYTHFFGLRHDGGPSAPRFKPGCTDYIGPPSLNYQGFFFVHPGSSPTGPVGPSELPWVEGTQRWDTDSSYGDWYTGHELGHTLGRVHVAKSNANSSCATGSSPLDTDTDFADFYPLYSFPLGKLSGPPLTSTEPYFVGFDVGDPSLGNLAPMRALPGDAWHDIMTYCARQWISSDAYKAILDRLNEEGQQEALQRAATGSTTTNPPPAIPRGLQISKKRTNPLILTTSGDHQKRRSPHTQEKLIRMIADQSPSIPAPQPAANIVKGDLIVVLTTVNITNQTAMTDSIIRVDSAVIPAPTQEQLVRIRLTAGADRHGPVLYDQAETVILRHSGRSKDQEVGTVRAVLPYTPGQATLDVLLSNQIIHTLRASKNAPKLNRIFAPTLGRRGVYKGNLIFRWDKATDDDNDKPTYSVQVRSNDVDQWRTIALDLPRAELTLDSERFKAIRNIQVKVIASDGFHSSSQVSAWFVVPHVDTP